MVRIDRNNGRHMAEDDSMIRLTDKHLSFTNYVMRHPTVYNDIADDGCPDPQDFTAEDWLRNDNMYFLSPNEHTIFIFHPMFHGVYQQHTCILPDGRGPQAISNCHLAWEYMHNKGAFKIMGFYPEYNRKASGFCERVGLKTEGRLTSAWKKNGDLFDLIIVGTEV